MSGKKRPFRIWSCDRKVKKTVVVASLTELCDKSKEKLGYKEDNIKIVLEHDGTLVDDEDYFSCIDDHTTVIVLRDGEKWESLLSGEDETDFTEHKGHKTRIEELSLLLRQDLAKLVTMSNDDLQILVDVDSSELCQLVGTSLTDGQTIQSGCQRVLDDRNQATEARQLLQLLAEKVTGLKDSKTTENSDVKRQRLA